MPPIRPAARLGDHEAHPLSGPDLSPPRETAEFLDRVRRAGRPEPLAAPSIPGVTIVAMVGSGGSGVVYRGRDEATGDDVAVKVVSRDDTLPDDRRARALREVAILSTLDHPNIVRVRASGECDVPGAGERPYLVMEWVGGGTLEQAWNAERPAPRVAAAIVRDLALAVETLHACGVVHRDIKPANVLLAASTAPGAALAPKLADFGLARREQHDTRVTQEGSVLGTPGFLAPEQAGIDPSLGTIGPATDIHGLGATLFFLLAGKPPHQGGSVVESLARAAHGAVDWAAPALAGLPRDLRTILEKSLERDPADRYRSAADLAADLSRFLDGRRVVARRRGGAARLARTLRRNPGAALAAAVATLVPVAAVVGLALDVGRVDSAARSADDAKALARGTMARLTDTTMERLLARGAALDEGSRTLLLDARDAYLRWPIGSDARADLSFRARGLRDVARVFARIDRLGDAAGAFAASRAAYDELDRRGLVDPAVRAARLGGLMEEYRFLIEAHRAADAEPLVARALDMVALPLDPRAGPTLSSALLCDRGFVLSAVGRGDESGKCFRAAVEHAARACDALPDDPAVAQDAQSALWNIGICAENAGRREEQATVFAELVERATTAVSRFPDRADDFRQAAIRGLHRLADAEFFGGEPDKSLATARRSTALSREAFEKNPDHPSARGALVESAVRESRAASRLGRAAEADAVIAEAVERAEAMAAAEPAVFFHSQRLVVTLRELAINRDLRGRAAEAVSAHGRIFALLAPWCESPDRGETVRSWSASSCAEAADVLRRSGDHAGAVEWLERAVAVAPPSRRPGLLMVLADEALARGDADRARSAATEAMNDPDAAERARRILARVGG